MTNHPNGWLGKPGVPLNPDRDGAHWLKGCWEDKPGMWEDEGWYIPSYSHKLDPETVATRYSYLGPCLTPAEVEARVQQGRRDALEEAARLVNQTAAVLSNPSAKDALNYTAKAVLALKGEGDE